MTLRRFTAVFVGLSLFVVGLAAQAPAKPPESQQQTNDDVLKELKAIHQLLERLVGPPQQAARQPQKPLRARVTNLQGYALGKPDAPLTMLEFSDMQCPFCQKYVSTSFDEIRKNWIDTGRLRYVSRDFPLDFHPHALSAAQAARCAGEQGQYWSVRLALTKNANALSAEYIKRTVKEHVANAAAFGVCMDSNKYAAEIAAEQLEGTKVGVAGTPTFVIGRTNGDSIEGPMLVGALPYATFDGALKELLDTNK